MKDKIENVATTEEQRAQYQSIDEIKNNYANLDGESLKGHLDTISSEIIEIQNALEAETEKQNKWKTENERRRHNYVPLIFELLQQLAKKNQLDDLFKDAVAKKKEKDEAEKNKTKA